MYKTSVSQWRIPIVVPINKICLNENKFGRTAYINCIDYSKPLSSKTSVVLIRIYTYSVYILYQLFKTTHKQTSVRFSTTISVQDEFQFVCFNSLVFKIQISVLARIVGVLRTVFYLCEPLHSTSTVKQCGATQHFSETCGPLPCYVLQRKSKALTALTLHQFAGTIWVKSHVLTTKRVYSQSLATTLANDFRKPNKPQFVYFAKSENTRLVDEWL